MDHIAALDGLRGIAAVVVVLRHTLNAVPMPPAWRFALYESPLALLLTSQGAVQLFFVLSGWVLAASLARSGIGPVSTASYFVRRVFRIHVPFVCAALLAFVVSRFWSVPDPDAVTGWIERSVVRPPLETVLASLWFPGRAAGVLPVGWTLTIEMIYSLAMPLLVLVARPARGALLMALGVAALFTPWPLAWYGVNFAFGVVAHQERAVIERWLLRIPSGLRAVVPLLGVLLISMPLWHRNPDPGRVLGQGAREIALMSAGSLLLVVSALAYPLFARVLGSRPGVFLGRISYGTYLLHRPLLTLLAPHVLVPMLIASKLVQVKGVTTESTFALFAMVLIGSILLAIPFHRYVEEPAIAAGKNVARALERWLRAARPRAAT